MVDEELPQITYLYGVPFVDEAVGIEEDIEYADIDGEPVGVLVDDEEAAVSIEEDVNAAIGYAEGALTVHVQSCMVLI